MRARAVPLASYTKKMTNHSTPFAKQYQLERNLRPFCRAEVQTLPKGRCGLYALWLPTELENAPERLYIGMSTTCVRRRLLEHLAHETNPELRRQLRLFTDLVEFSVAFTNSEQETRALEAAIIRAWQPETNRKLL